MKKIKTIMILTIIAMIVSCNNGNDSTEDSINNQIKKVIKEINLYQINAETSSDYDIAVRTARELSDKVNTLIEIGISDEEAKGWLTNLKVCLADIKLKYENMGEKGKEGARPELFQEGKDDLIIQINKVCDEVLKYYRIYYCENNCERINQYDMQIDRGRSIAESYKREAKKSSYKSDLENILGTMNGWINMCESTYQQACDECKITMKTPYDERPY